MPRKKTHDEFMVDLQARNGRYRCGEFEVTGEYARSSDKIELRCPEHGPFRSTANYLLRGGGCPACGERLKVRNRTGKTAAKTHKQFLAELEERNEHYRNHEFRVTSQYLTSRTKVACFCPSHGAWDVKPQHLLRGHGCPECNPSHKKKAEDFAEEMRSARKDIEVLGTYIASNRKIAVRCLKCGNEWQTKPNSLQQGSGCPKCARTSTSRAEQLICAFMEQVFGADNVKSRDKSAIGLELDVICRKHAFEFGSWYWHRSEKKQRADAEKRARCSRAGITLHTVYDSCKGKRPAIDGADVLFFDNDLWEEPGHSNLKRLCLEWAAQIDATHPVPEIDWGALEQAATSRTRAIGADEFASRLRESNPRVEYLDGYQSMTSTVWARCLRCDNKWAAKAYSLLQGHGCPECAKQTIVSRRTGKTARKTHGQFLSELRIKNQLFREGKLSVTGEYVLSNTPIECRCHICGNKFEIRPQSLLRGKGCPQCGRKAGHEKLKTSRRLDPQAFQARLSALHPTLTLISEYTVAKQKVMVRCDVCGHEWEAFPVSLTRGKGCPACNRGHQARLR